MLHLNKVEINTHKVARLLSSKHKHGKVRFPTNRGKLIMFTVSMFTLSFVLSLFIIIM